MATRVVCIASQPTLFESGSGNWLDFININAIVNSASGSDPLLIILAIPDERDESITLEVYDTGWNWF